jgi:hypothetical protein
MSLAAAVHGAVPVRFMQTMILLEHQPLDQVLTLRERWVLPAQPSLSSVHVCVHVWIQPKQTTHFQVHA